ncbi:MAG: hypothetical protein U0795_20125 [Pirellulales bacterium]
MTATPQPNLSSERYNVRRLKGFNPGAADMATMLEDAAANAAARKQMLWLPASIASYPVSRTVVFPSGLDVWLDGESVITYTGSDGTIPVVQHGAEDTFQSQRTVRLNATRSTPTDWTNPTAVAVRLCNLNDSWLDVAGANSTVGVECFSHQVGHGFAYNYVQLRRLVDNRYALRLWAKGRLGWVNENQFAGGRFAVTSTRRQVLGYPTASGSGAMYPVGVWMTGDFNGINSNVFIKPSFEIGPRDYAVAGEGGWYDMACVQFDAVRCAYNRFLQARHENTGNNTKNSVFFRFNAPGCTRNRAELSYYGNWPQWTNGTTKGMIEYWTEEPTQVLDNIVIPGGGDEELRPAWTSEELGKVAKRCNAAGAISIPKWHWFDGFTRRRQSSQAHVVPSHGRYVTIGKAGFGNEGIGVLLDTSLCKHFAVKVNPAEGTTTNARLFLMGFNSDRTTIMNKHGCQIPSTNLTINQTTGAIEAVAVTGAYAGNAYSAAPSYRLWGGNGSGANLTVNMSGSAPNMSVASITVNSGGLDYAFQGATSLTHLTLSQPSEVDIMVASGLPTSWGGKQTQPSAGWRHAVIGPNVKFVELLVWVAGGLSANIHSVSIQSLDYNPILVSSYYEDVPQVPWVLEKPDSSWLTDGGCWAPGSFVVNAATETALGANRPLGYLYAGNNKFTAVPHYYVGTSAPSDTDMIWIDITGL